MIGCRFAPFKDFVTIDFNRCNFVRTVEMAELSIEANWFAPSILYLSSERVCSIDNLVDGNDTVCRKLQKRVSPILVTLTSGCGSD